MSQESAYRQSLVRELVALSAETGWVEFKHNNADAQQIGASLGFMGYLMTGMSKATFHMGVFDFVSHNQCVTRSVLI